ncbi:MAG: formylglycine-generating enzyme family protein [Deltaproteobacteria bacterium]|nr:formylglycine-generating enzyme family protein [Deltaproteobacteria bacterium]
MGLAPTKREEVDVLEKKCPVCFYTLDASLLRCPRCGWDFPSSSGHLADSARWLLGRISDARRNWLSKKSSVTLGLAPPIVAEGGKPGPRPPADPGPWRAPRITLVRPTISPGDLAVFNSLDFCDIPSGLFQMGTNHDDKQGQEYEKPVHGVILSRPFRLAKYQVTQNLWEFCMGYNPSHFRGDMRPVENVTWREVQDFIQRLNSTSAQRYRLPTEAEWEYAARAGQDSPYYFGQTPDELPQHAWFGHNSGHRTQNIGLKDPNPWGLHDMLGNVWEWVSDWYGDYGPGTATNPKGPTEGSSKVIRGGGWGSAPWFCRVTTRSVKSPDERSPLIGFRLALDGSWADDFVEEYYDEFEEGDEGLGFYDDDDDDDDGEP